MENEQAFWDRTIGDLISQSMGRYFSLTSLKPSISVVLSPSRPLNTMVARLLKQFVHDAVQVLFARLAIISGGHLVSY